MTRFTAAVDAVMAASGLGMTDAALVLAGAGVPVFPCIQGGKRPVTAHGFLDATTDPSRIQDWWCRGDGFNIGVPTGPVSGIDVLDVDLRPSGSGFEALDGLARAGLVGGWGLGVATPSGGLHLYYPASAARPSSSWACGAAHIDYRGLGGYVVAAPSTVQMSSGERAGYAVACTQPGPHRPLDAAKVRSHLDPQAAMRRISTRNPARRGGPTGAGGIGEGLARWVASRPVGERNTGLFWASCRMVEAGYDQAFTLAALTPAAQQAGLLDREITQTVISAYRHTRPQPGQARATLPVAPVRAAPVNAVGW
jgi:hypothetical protein